MDFDEYFNEFFKEFMKKSDDEIVALAKRVPDNGGKLLVELQEFMIRRQNRMDNLEQDTPSGE